MFASKDIDFFFEIMAEGIHCSGDEIPRELYDHAEELSNNSIIVVGDE